MSAKKKIGPLINYMVLYKNSLKTCRLYFNCTCDPRLYPFRHIPIFFQLFFLNTFINYETINTYMHKCKLSETATAVKCLFVILHKQYVDVHVHTYNIHMP